MFIYPHYNIVENIIEPDRPSVRMSFDAHNKETIKVNILKDYLLLELTQRSGDVPLSIFRIITFNIFLNTELAIFIGNNLMHVNAGIVLTTTLFSFIT